MVCIFLSDLIRIEELVLNQINAAQKDGRILQRGWNQMTVLFHGIVKSIGDIFTNSGAAPVQNTVQNNNIRIKGVQQIVNANGHISNKVLHQTSGIRIALAVKIFKNICMNRHML